MSITKRFISEFSSDHYGETYDLTVETILLIDGEQYLTGCNLTQEASFNRRTPVNYNKELKIDKITQNAQISISLKLFEGLDQEIYLGTTTFDIFDSQRRLKDGPFYLVFWPFITPDFTKENFAPGKLKRRDR